ncbi:HTH-type transcriptional regulator KdgR [Clostridium ljungdahlii]|uniref:HTH-type transcriptional regulator KdgR n=1 Tax=Clostridium ljungdahlii TaxID=1538 RepID=A0A166SBE5_9CLOT|nr:HTH-type transcriptional regulator KdgR [Clostridium ljungdahlii]
MLTLNDTIILINRFLKEEVRYIKPEKKIVIDDVAKKAGVSKSTISRYLNGKFEYMSQKTRKNIEKVIDELDYRPNSIARSLKLKRSMLIQVIIADLTNPFSSLLIKGVGDECGKYGYNVIIANTDNDKDKEREYILSLTSQNVDGLIINSTGYNRKLLKDVLDQGIPVVTMDRIIDDKVFDSVTSNNYDMTFKTINYLIDSGFKNIALFTQHVDKISVRIEREKAFLDACNNRLNSSNFNVYTIDRHDTGSVELSLFDFLNNYKESKAIFAINGVVLLNVLQLINKFNLKIPEDVGICGYDNWGWASLISPGITTISQPSYDIGMRSAKILLDRIKHGKGEKNTCIYLNSKLEIRGSTVLK